MSALFIVRTPLQAWIAELVLRTECTQRFDLVYITVEDALEDRHSFYRFSRDAEFSKYLVLKRRWPDILHQLELAYRLEYIRRTAVRRWDKVFLASFEAHGINAMVQRIKPSFIVGFDDGTANINLNGKYSAGSMSRRERIYRRLFGGATNHEFVQSITRHYTIFDEIPHLVPREKLIPLRALVETSSKKTDAVVSYFIGQPFEDVLNQAQIERFKVLLSGEPIDKYVTHPRERRALIISDKVCFLDKKGEVAERAIDLDANGRSVWLYGWFSTVMFTLRPIAARRLVFLARDDKKTPELAEIAKQGGCEVYEF